MSLKEDIAKEARMEGKEAFRDGKTPPSNPHPTGTRECSSWYEGWYAERNLEMEERLFPKELKDSDAYQEFQRFLFPDNEKLTTNEFLSHWWWNKMERKRLFEIWKDQE